MLLGVVPPKAFQAGSEDAVIRPAGAVPRIAEETDAFFPRVVEIPDAGRPRVE